MGDLFCYFQGETDLRAERSSETSRGLRLASNLDTMFFLSIHRLSKLMGQITWHIMTPLYLGVKKNSSTIVSGSFSRNINQVTTSIQFGCPYLPNWLLQIMFSIRGTSQKVPNISGWWIDYHAKSQDDWFTARLGWRESICKKTHGPCGSRKHGFPVSRLRIYPLVI